MFNEDKNMDSSRRDFMKKAAIGVAAVACGSAICSCGDGASPEPVKDKVRLLSPTGEIVEVDPALLKPIPDIYIDPVESREGIPGRRFVMVIDLAQCKNLRKCHDACEAMHHCGPDKEFLKVLKVKSTELAGPYWQPSLCFHCDNPPCVKVCPVDATFKRDDGIVLIDTDRCIGCRFCMVACPYSARVFDWSEPELTNDVLCSDYSPEKSYPAKMGTVSKCDFCPDVVRKGEMPHCVSACPNGVFYFGDENEDAVSNGTATVKLSQLLHDRGGYRYLEDLGTRPRVYYLPAVNRAFPFEDDEFTAKKSHES